MPDFVSGYSPFDVRVLTGLEKQHYRHLTDNLRSAEWNATQILALGLGDQALATFHAEAGQLLAAAPPSGQTANRHHYANLQAGTNHLLQALDEQNEGPPSASSNNLKALAEILRSPFVPVPPVVSQRSAARATL